MNDMQLLLVAGLAAIAAGASLFGLYSIIRQRRKRRGNVPAADAAGSLPYRRVDALLTPSERALYRILCPIAETVGAEVFAKVRLDDVIQVRKGAAKYEVHRSKVAACGIDFLLCDRQKLVPLLALQMDGIARGRTNREEHERFLMQALDAVGVPIFRVPARASYDVEEIGALVHEQVGGPWDRPGTTPVQIAPEGGPVVPQQEEPTVSYVQAGDQAPGTAGVDSIPNWLDPTPVPPAWPAAVDAVGAPEEDPPAVAAPAEAGEDLELTLVPELSLAAAVDSAPEWDGPSGDSLDEETPPPAFELPEAPAVNAPTPTESEAAPADTPAFGTEDEMPAEDAAGSHDDPPQADPAPAAQVACDAAQPAEDSAPAAGAAPCPACGRPLVPMQDVDTGEIVLACSGYPECTYISPAS